jgi:hypothetical protein
VNPDQTKRAGVLAALLVLLASLLAWQLWPSGAAPIAAGAPAQPDAGPATAPQATPVDPSALDVRLDRLTAERKEPEETGRDPFSLRPPPPPPAPPPPPPVNRPNAVTGTPGEADPGEPPPPPPPPPITLKFIGVVTRETKVKIAVLSDGRFVFHGREGDIIEGRYRVVRIGEESVQMEYVDGRGRQTIRLSGS